MTNKVITSREIKPSSLPVNVLLDGSVADICVCDEVGYVFILLDLVSWYHKFVFSVLDGVG